MCEKNIEVRNDDGSLVAATFNKQVELLTNAAAAKGSKPFFRIDTCEVNF